MQIQNTKKLAAALEESENRLSAKGEPYTALDQGVLAVEILDLVECYHIVVDVATAAAERRMVRKRLRLASDAQLVLPGLQNLGPMVKVAGAYLSSRTLTLEKYRALKRECEARIEKNVRRSERAVNRDKELLRELRRFDPIFALHAAGDPAMTLERAAELHRASLETPQAKRNRKAGRARQRSNQKSTT